MANKVLLKKSAVAARVPVVGDLDYGELALNYADGKLYFKNSSNAIKSFTIDDSVVTLTGTQTLSNKSFSNNVNLIPLGTASVGTQSFSSPQLTLQSSKYRNGSTFTTGYRMQSLFDPGTNTETLLFDSPDSNDRGNLIRFALQNTYLQVLNTNDAMGIQYGATYGAGYMGLVSTGAGMPSGANTSRYLYGMHAASFAQGSIIPANGFSPNFRNILDNGSGNLICGSLNTGLGGTSTITATNFLQINHTTPSTSTTSGALQVAGGVGIAENLYVGGNAVITGNLTVNGTTTTINGAVTIGSTTGTDTLIFGRSSGAQTVNIANGANTSATKSVNIGTNSAGGATNIIIGSGTGVSTTFLNGNIRPALLTASQAVFTDASKNLVSVATTGTGNVVLAASPTITGQVSFDDGSAASPSITNTGDTNTGIFFPAADTIAFTEGGVEAMRIDSVGNVGLGTTPSSWFSGLKVFQFPTGNIFTNGEEFYITQGLQINPAGSFVSTNVVGGGTGGTTNDVSMYVQSDGQHTWFTSVGSTVSSKMFLTNTGALVLSQNGFFDSKGDTRAAPINTKTAAYVAVAYDAGQTIYISTGGVTINASTFSAGDMLTIVNNSAANQTITAGASVTFRLAGTATTGNRTLAQYGMATFLCVVGGTTPTFHCSGAGLT